MHGDRWHSAARATRHSQTLEICRRGGCADDVRNEDDAPPDGELRTTTAAISVEHGAQTTQLDGQAGLWKFLVPENYSNAGWLWKFLVPENYANVGQ